MGYDTHGMSPRTVIEILNRSRQREQACEPTPNERVRLERLGIFVAREFRSVAQARAYFEESCKEWEDSLTQDEIAAVKDYTGKWYAPINSYLRGSGLKRYSIYSELDVSNHISLLEFAISKFELKEDIRVFRGTDPIEFGRNVVTFDDVKKLEGQSVTLKAFTSTSTRDDIVDESEYNKSVIIDLTVRKGFGKGAYIEFLSIVKKKDESRNESEFLLQKSTNLRIKNVSLRSDGKIVVTAEVD